mgnify:CR=1 FL=1
MSDLTDTREFGQPLILALGHPLCRDDGVGLHILRELEQVCSPFTDCLAGGQELLCRLKHLTYRPVLIILDAIDGGYPPGTAIRLVISGDDLLETLSLDTAHSHGSNLGLALALIRQSGVRLPTVVIYGVQPTNMALGDQLTPDIAQAAGFLARQLMIDRPWNNVTCLSSAVWLNRDQIT